MGEQQLHALCRHARAAITHGLGGPRALRPTDPAFEVPSAVFVTLRHPDGELQGCIGSIEPLLPLGDAVERYARAAAFEDPRARRLELGEEAGLSVELSLLSPAEPLRFESEADALSQLRPHVDGVVLSWRDYRATFLPQVWESLPNAVDFIEELKRKAGLSRAHWDDEMRLERYTVRKVVEPGAPGPASGMWS